MCRKDSAEKNDPTTRNEHPTQAIKRQDGSRQRPIPVKNVLLVAPAMIKQVIAAARNGQALPQLTLLLTAQLGFRVLTFFGVFALPIASTSRLEQASLAILITSSIAVICGYITLIALYRHSVTTIFNRSLPPSLLQCMPSFGAHLALLKPLEVLFRYATARFRVLPDILVLGEVRCGTTTLCQHLSSLKGCEPPFCLWKHPELDRKETFYFVGHYLGRVDPLHYRMCFPLAIVKWFRQRILGQPYFTFDGCAQYLTNPAVPYLIAKAYSDAGQPPPILVACVRNPVHQAVSWWKYENNAMLWGGSMGLTEWNTELRSPQYPPLTISGALEFSLSDTVEEAYRMTEDLFRELDDKPNISFVLPPWAMTWPGGQLSGIGRNGCFAANIRRYEEVFSAAFSGQESGGADDQEELSEGIMSKLQFVNIVPLEFVGDESKLKLTLASLMSQMDRRRRNRSPLLKESMSDFQNSHRIHRNAGTSTQSDFQEPSLADAQRLEAFFSRDAAELEGMLEVRTLTG